jgi:preprotein translocase subunit SecY
MFRAVTSVFRNPKLRLTVLLTLLAFCVYRIAFYVPSPGVDLEKLSAHWKGTGLSAEQAAKLFVVYPRSGLGIMPYIGLAALLTLLAFFVYRVFFYVPSPGNHDEKLAAHRNVTGK